MKVLKGDYGECRFCDNMDQEFGLPSLKEKSWDLCLTDPPYNLSCRTMENKMDCKIRYEDNMEEDEYQKWSFKWFKECELKSKMVVFTPGYKNFNFWMKHTNFEVAILYDISSQGGCKIASFRKWEPILTKNIEKNRKQHKAFKFAIFEEINYVSQLNFGDFLHPCPKNIKLWERIVRELKPTSVLDPFLGSGTTAQVCERLGIPWLGYEIMEEYAPDIEKRIKKGIVEHSRYTPPKKYSQNKLESFQTYLREQA